PRAGRTRPIRTIRTRRTRPASSSSWTAAYAAWVLRSARPPGATPASPTTATRSAAIGKERRPHRRRAGLDARPASSRRFLVMRKLVSPIYTLLANRAARRSSLALLLAALVCATGCGKSARDAVSGKVTFKGQPVAGTVSFLGTNGKEVTAPINPDGT